MSKKNKKTDKDPRSYGTRYEAVMHRRGQDAVFYYSETGMNRALRLRDSLLPVILSIILYVFCAMRRAGSGHMAYVVLPFLGICLPLILQLIAAIRNMVKVTDYTEWQKSDIVDRQRNCALAAAGMAAWAAMSQLMFIIFDRTTSPLQEDIMLLLGLIVIGALNATSYFLQKKHEWIKR